MTIFYFTSTGNSLAVAKRIGGNLISIPQIISDLKPEYKDDAIGVVFPVYGFFIPKMARRFLAETKLSANYTFAIGTYGNMPGACMRNVQKYALDHGNRIDYAESLLMVDNYLPNFEIADQIAKLPKKNPEENLKRIIADIEAQKKLEATASLLWRLFTSAIAAAEKAWAKDTQAQSYILNKDCVSCGICAKICPAGNISVTDKVQFGSNCEWCLGCVHLCPKNAIHLKNEKSAERWRNPEVSLKEIIAANNRI
ncbi:MAG: EFR1 family ferrodoxin [Clostridiales bacterium]|nr:EFR1 family ferrodoxin [Clostridiales bacterium]